MTLDAVADELYGGDPSEFVARREALAKDARAAKDRALAAAIKALRRPTVGAWYVNLASRARLLSLVELLALGAELRDAQAAGDFRRVVDLGPRRAQLERRTLADLTAHLDTLGIAASPAALEEVRSTLRAAVTDADAAAAVQSGRLDRPLEYGHVGFATVAGPIPEVDQPDTEPTADREPAPPEALAPDSVEPPEQDAELAALERQAAEAEAALQASRLALAEAQARREHERALTTAEVHLTQVRAEEQRALQIRDGLVQKLADAEDALAAATAATAHAASEFERLRLTVAPADASVG